MAYRLLLLKCGLATLGPLANPETRFFVTAGIDRK
jgi:hypothetical protein